MNGSEKSALSILLADLLEEILSRADNPGECASHLAGRIREIIGVKTVLVFLGSEFSRTRAHELVSAVPARRKDFASEPGLLRLLDTMYELDSSRFLDPDEECAEPLPTALGAALREAGFGPSILVPLRYAEKRMGALLLLDILDRSGLENLLATLDRLSGVLALVLRNSFMYLNLEDAVRHRTADLLAEREQLRTALEEKNVLLQEIHHRVKNNLQIIESLLYLQGQRTGEAEAASALRTARGRITSMALVHEELYSSDDLSSVDLGRYVPRLARAILASHGCPAAATFSLAPLPVSLNAGIHLGLILNELVTNAVKYALRDRSDGRLEIRIEAEGGECRIELRDDGPGFPPDLPSEGRERLGMSIVRSLAEQFGGTVRWFGGIGREDGAPGMTVEVRLSREALER